MDESLNHEPSADAGVFIFEPRRALAWARAWAGERAAVLVCAALLAAMSLQMLSVIARKSITVDEIVLIPAAYYHLAAGDCQLVNEHPPLVKLLAAVPLLFVQPKEAQVEKFGVPPDSAPGKWKYEEGFWEDNGDIFDSLSFWPRVPMIALTVALGILVFAFARELFNERAAVLAVALFTLEPTVLAHGRVVQTDIAASFGYLLVFFALYRYVREPSMRRALLVGVAGGVACLAKFSMLVCAPVVGVVLLAMRWRAPKSRPSRKSLALDASLVALASLVVVNAAYFFDHRPLGAEDTPWLLKSFKANGETVVRAADALSYVLPTDFVYGVFWQVWHNGEGHPAGLLGQYRDHGWWYYFPVAFALKTTLPFLLLSLASLAWGAYKIFRERDTRFVVMLAPFVLYTVFVMMSNIDIGVRYYLPAYMFLFITGGALLERMLRSWRTRRALAVVACALLVWVCIEAARAYPDHMSYMNQLASRAPHWWYLSDSNVEWGDDVRPLADYLRARGETRVRGAFLGGFLSLHHYGIGYTDAIFSDPSQKPPRYTAVGASYLNGSTVPGHQIDGRQATEEERVNTFDSYRRRTPEKVIGSIYLFREDGR
jgi:Dolichyl-phosphate-mannose-protein mannosyltransferase